jgi:hypothetical protein
MKRMRERVTPLMRVYRGGGGGGGDRRGAESGAERETEVSWGPVRARGNEPYVSCSTPVE